MVKRYQSRERDFLLESDFLFSNKKSDSTASAWSDSSKKTPSPHLTARSTYHCKPISSLPFPLTTSKIGTHFLHVVYIMTWSSLNAMGTLICQNRDPILNEMGTQNMHMYIDFECGSFSAQYTNWHGIHKS